MSDRDDDFMPDIEGDCHNCDGTGEIVHSRCDGSGCSGCCDGQATCPECGGSGFSNDHDDRLDEDGGPMTMSDMIPW